MHGRHTFPKSEHLRYGHEFRGLYRDGRRAEGSRIVLYAREWNPAETPAPGPVRRLGVVTSRRVGNAVARNRARRLMREVYRLNKHKLKDHVELIMIARPSIKGKSYQEVESDALRLFRAAAILREP